MIGVILIMLATYYAGEYWDYTEDSISGRLGKSMFAGGSRILQRGLVARSAPLRASLVCLVLAFLVSIILQFIYHTGTWTIALGMLGMLGGFFYSAKPLRWVARGWGEIWIAFCYGWLPIAAGCYLQTATIVPIAHRLAIPIGMTIFNVIVLNEFPDYEADRATGKNNIVVRLGRKNASLVYGSVGLISLLFANLWLAHGIVDKGLYFYLPFSLLSLGLIVLVIGGAWHNRKMLELLCGANILVNLGTTSAFIYSFLAQ